MQSRSKKTRESLRRYRNRLLRELGETLTLRVFRDPNELELLVRDLDSVAAKTYQRGLGIAFADTPEHRALMRLGLEQGWWRVYVLYSDEEPIAFWPGSAYNGVFSIGTPGYDPAYTDYRIGTYVLLKVIEDLCADDDVELVDFGFGDAEYKRRFANESWPEADVVLFAPTFRAARINLTRTALAGAAGTVRSLLTRLGVAQRLRRRWRRRLADSDEAPKSAARTPRSASSSPRGESSLSGLPVRSRPS
jgi:hypothetical protein